MAKIIKTLTDLFSLLSIFEIMALCVTYSACYHSTYIGNSTQKPHLTVIFLLGMLMFFLLFLLKRFPRFFPFPVKITAKNMVRQAALSSLFLSVFSLLSTPVFIFTIYSKYRSILYDPTAIKCLHPAIIPVLLTIIIICTAVYILMSRMIELKKQEHIN